ncbi:MAG: tetratricopeptide repeat protein [bacterium]
MTTNRFAKIREILLAVSDLSLTEQTDYLDTACADDPELRREIESILAHNDNAPEIIRTVGVGALLARHGNEFLQEPAAEFPEQIDAYRIVEVLGEGGMGVVYLAEQIEPIRRQVALKLMRWGLNLDQVVARFELERQTLALMEHPNIAKVLAAGADAQGRPYFVMELVRGAPITKFCAENEIPIEDRLRLVIQVCKAVQHAHQKGIIHRDLKPSNLLVARQDGVPTPKVIDFGIAKAVEESAVEIAQLTREGQPIGTLKYMSPEQTRGNSRGIDTRSDVYSLGAILYELLTGSAPCEPSSPSLIDQVRATCEEAPRPFSELGSGAPDIDRDLEIIAFKALAKDPIDRYQSVSDLGGDLERFLNSEPIIARPPSTTYQLKRLIERNKLPSLLVGSIAVMVIAFGIWMSFLYTRSEANLKRALQAEGEAGEVSDFMVGLFEISDPSEARGNSITAREILDEGAERIEQELGDQPEIQSRLMHTMGVSYCGLGIYDRSQSLLESALVQHDALSSDRTLAEAEILTDLGSVYLNSGQTAAADSCFTSALAIRREQLPPDDPRVAAGLANLGWAYAIEGRFAESETMLVDAVAILEEFPDFEPRALPATVNNLAQVYQVNGKLDQAEALYLRALAMREERLPVDHPDIANNHSNLASFYTVRGEPATATAHAQQALDIWERILSPEHPDVATALINLAEIQRTADDLESAEQNILRALAIMETSLGPEHRQVARTLNNLGLLYLARGDLTKAENALERSRAINTQNESAEHPLTVTVLNNLGELRLAQKRLRDAELLFQHVLEIRDRLYGADDPRTALPLYNLGRLRLAQGRHDEAEELLLRSLAIREQTLGPVHYRIAEALEACVVLYQALGKAAVADSLALLAVAQRQQM